MNADLLIPFNKPYVAPKSIEYIREALESSHHQGGGPFNKKAANLVSSINSGGEVFLTGSCTQALEMATLLLGLKPGDEVIMPSYTFTSAATALVNYGVIPVFVDIEPDHLNIDPNKVRQAITEKTKAISIVNYAGNACAFDELTRIAEEFDLFKIEDNAHGFGAQSYGYDLGKWGDVITLSYHATKNIQCGEGGALIVKNEKLSDKAHILQEKGTNRKQFLEGQIERYQWVDKGGSFLLNEISSALLCAQLEIFELIQADRYRSWYRYFQNLSTLSNEQFFFRVNEKTGNAAHMFYLLVEPNIRPKLLQFLKSRGVQAQFHYQPLHSSGAGKNFGITRNSITESDNIAESLLRLPLWCGMSPTEVDIISDTIHEFFRSYA